MIELGTFFDELLNQVCELDEKFLLQYFPVSPALSPADFALDVHAYCVLAHAAMEEFVERVALRVMHKTVDAWTTRQVTSDTLVLLLAHNGLNVVTEAKPGQALPSVSDQINSACNAARDRYSKAIHKNHGVSPEYLQSMLVPLAIDVTGDANLINSLRQLAKARGAYAHSPMAAVKNPMAPEDARKYVLDCLVLCEDIYMKAVGKLEALDMRTVVGVWRTAHGREIWSVV